MRYNFLLIFTCVLFIIIFTFLISISFEKIKEHDILYDRFEILQIIHSRLIVIQDRQTNQKYWMGRDYKWMIISPYLESNDSLNKY